MADLNDLWIQITAESDDIDDSAPVDVAAARALINAHNTSDTAHTDIRAQLQAIADTQTQEIKEYESKRQFPVSGDTSVTIYVDVSTGNLYRYNTSSRRYEELAMDTIPNSVSLEGVPTAPTARLGTNTLQIATTAFVQNELAQIREQADATTPVYYDGKTKAKLSLLGENGTIVTNIANGKVEQGSSDAVTGGQLWAAQQDMSNMSALAARNIAANAAEIELLKQNQQDSLVNPSDEAKDSITALVNIIGNDNIHVVTETDEEHVKNVTLSVVTNGQVIEGNTGLVTGDTVYQAINESLADARSYITAGDGITVVNGKVSVDDSVAKKNDLEEAALAAQFIIVNGDHTAAMLGETDGKQAYSINVRANGSVQKNDGRIVTGGTIYNETRVSRDGHVVQENNTAAQNLAALDAALHTVSSQLDSIPDAMMLGENLTQLQENTAQLRTDVTALQNKEAQLLDKDLETLSEDGKRVIRDLSRDVSLKMINGDHTVATLGEEDGVPTYAINVRANGAIAARDGRIITGQTVFNEVRVEEDGAVIESTATTGANLKALDEAYAKLNHKVDVIAGDAPETQYRAGNFITVSDDRVISVQVNGVVEDNNTGLVTGDQVADAVRAVQTESGQLIQEVHDELTHRIERFEELEYTGGEGILIDEDHVISTDPAAIKKIAAPVIYNSADSFPETGDPGKLYVDAETNSLYRWDTEIEKYKEIQGNTINDCVTGIERDGDQLQITKADSSVTSVPLHSPLTNEEIDTLF